MQVSTRERRRIVWRFLLGIGLPGLLLGSLAWRGIRNDQALVDKIRFDDHRRAAELISKTIHDTITSIEQDLLEALPGRQSRAEPNPIPALEAFVREHPLVESVCLCDAGTIRFPVTKLLFLPAGTTPPPAVSSQAASVTDVILNGQHLEFERQDYPGALAAYEQALGRTSDTRARAELAAAVARVQKKARLYEAAITSYARIDRDLGHVRSAGGVRLGLAARMELASLYATIHDTTRSLETSLALYAALVNGEWPLEEAQYQLYSQRVRTSIREILDQPQPDARLRAQASLLAALEASEARR